VKNYATCSGMDLLGTDDLHNAEALYAGQNLPTIISQLETYGDKNKRKYVHFVDGGITDNLGIRAVTDIAAITGNPAEYYGSNWRPPRQLVVIAVNAATQSEDEMDTSNKDPSSVHVARAITKLQLTRYDVDSMLLARQLLETWAAKMSTPGHPIETHLVSVDIQDIEDPATREYINNIPTSFKLDGEQVDKLIAVGRQLLRADPEYQELLGELGSH